MRRVVTATVAVLVLAGCSGGGSGPTGSATAPSTAPATKAPASSVSNGSIFVYPIGAKGALRYQIKANGSVGKAAAVPWEKGAGAEATLLKDAVGPWALTSIVQTPLTDVSATKKLQVRKVTTGKVVHSIKVPGWCSGPDGASYPCLLLSEKQLLRTTPIDGERSGKITISTTTTGKTVAKFGPFPALEGVVPTNSSNAVVVISHNAKSKNREFRRLNVDDGVSTVIGSMPTSRLWMCVLGSDSILTYTDKLQVMGPAKVAAVAVPELTGKGPGAEGCSADGAYLYVRTGEYDTTKKQVVDAIKLADGSRKHVLTLPSGQATLQFTR